MIISQYYTKFNAAKKNFTSIILILLIVILFLGLFLLLETKKIKKITNINSQMIDQYQSELNRIINKTNYALIENTDKLTFFLDYNYKRQDLTKFNNNYFEIIGKKSYLDTYNDDLYLLTSKGKLYKGSMLKDKIDFNYLDSNLNNYIYPLALIDDENIMRDLLISEDKIFISLWLYKGNKEGNYGCFKDVVIASNINNINFEILYERPVCYPRWKDKNGLKLSEYKDNYILMTIGDSGHYADVQSLNSYHGKIIKINIHSGESTIIASGIRDSLGIYYCATSKKIFFTDMGPEGGDEINSFIEKKEVANFGWPISSYGNHYKIENISEEALEYQNKYAPLYKNHKDYSFIEPMAYFEKAPPTDIYVKSLNSDNHLIYFLTLGNEIDSSKEHTQSIITLTFKNNILIEKKIKKNERLRDLTFFNDKLIIFSEKGNIFYFSPDEIREIF